MKTKIYKALRYYWYWIVGLFCFLWVLLRSGTNPKRYTYPCQQVAIPLAVNWILAILAFFCGSVLLKKIIKFSGIIAVIAGIIWFTGTVPKLLKAKVNKVASITLPVWEVPDPLSKVFVMDSIPPTSGSLAAGDASVPDEYLHDAAIDTLVNILAAQDVFLHKTDDHPDGIVGSDNYVVIKGNFQWESRNTTNTDRIKGLIWQILNHPDGFSGEILVCDNTQNAYIDDDDNNSEDPAQSIGDVVNTFSDKNYPVYLMELKYLGYDVVSEYSDENYNDGYIYNDTTKVSYPKFQSPSGNYYISFSKGIWDSVSGEYDPSRLCIIDFPVLKTHGWAGATVAVKNWVGVLTTANKDERYGGNSSMHNDYFFSEYALVARVMAITYPKLVIVDATWTKTDPDVWENTNMLVASTDPVAASWYAAKYILTPIVDIPDYTNPDRNNGKYNIKLQNWTTYLSDIAGLPCTKDSTEISVFDRSILGPAVPLWGDVDDDYVINIADALKIATYDVDCECGALQPIMSYITERGNVDADDAIDIVDALICATYELDPENIANPRVGKPIGTVPKTVNAYVNDYHDYVIPHITMNAGSDNFSYTMETSVEAEKSNVLIGAVTVLVSWNSDKYSYDGMDTVQGNVVFNEKNVTNGQLRMAYLDVNGKNKICFPDIYLTRKNDGTDWFNLEILNAAEAKTFRQLETKNDIVSSESESKKLPNIFDIKQNFPNPFNASTTIKYSLIHPTYVNVSIYNIQGQKVRDLVNGFVNSGEHSVVWDGTNDRGIEVSSGVYLYQLSASSTKITKQMSLLR